MQIKATCIFYLSPIMMKVFNETKNADRDMSKMDYYTLLPGMKLFQPL